MDEAEGREGGGGQKVKRDPYQLIIIRRKRM